MGKIELEIHEGGEAKDMVAPKTANITLNKYIVTAQDGLFKRGKLWKKGVTIELDELTAKNFLNNKEIRKK